MSSHRCERNLAGREEDIGLRVTYVPCGAFAPWTIEQTRFFPSFRACDAHMHEALMEGATLEEDGS